MGSATVSNAKPRAMETTDKKSIKTFFKSIIFHKKKDKYKCNKKETVETKPETKNNVEPTQNSNTVAAILENFNKLKLEEKKPIEQEKKENEDDEDEMDNFTIKVIEEPRNERINSHSSEDSGFSENKEAENTDKAENADKTEKSDKLENNEQTDDLAEDLEKLDLDDDKNKKKKKKQTVFMKRSPMKQKICSYSVDPYPSQEQDSYRQISQINKHTLTGGQVIVNQCQGSLSEINIAVESIQKKWQYFQNDQETYFKDVMEVISEDTNEKCVEIPAFSPVCEYQEQNANNIDYCVQNESIPSTSVIDYVETSVQHDDLMKLLEAHLEGPPDITEKECNKPKDGFLNAECTYPTPPGSVPVPSPMTASPASYYPSNSECSPGRSPVCYNSDYEKYQDIPHFEEAKDATDKKTRERTVSISSMTMKQFKDMQKEIVNNFSKRDCCQNTRKSCKELFKAHILKINADVRRNSCVNVSKLDLKVAYGVLHNILINLSKSSDNEDIQYALFNLICERMLSQDPTLFIGDGGLNLLHAAALRCPDRPLFTRYLVECIRIVLATDRSLVTGKDYIFHEIDALGDNLLIACARAGDRCSDVLSEIVRAYEDQPPLFKMHHTNSDGYTALHVACSKHSAASPRLHIVHVLLVHAGFEITEGDLKGGDTALHLAVNSANCDLQLILMMFKQVDRKDWKNLAHWANLSSRTPIELARLATKTSTRTAYPQEVLDFLKKCR